MDAVNLITGRTGTDLVLQALVYVGDQDTEGELRAGCMHCHSKNSYARIAEFPDSNEAWEWICINVDCYASPYYRGEITNCVFCFDEIYRPESTGEWVDRTGETLCELIRGDQVIRTGNHSHVEEN